MLLYFSIALRGIKKSKEILIARGGKISFVVADTGHLMGGCRMGNDPTTSVVNSFGQCHDISNLFISGSSIFVTGGGTNPTGTVMALAARTADYLIDRMKKGPL